jgi:hypothetical protein
MSVKLLLLPLLSVLVSACSGSHSAGQSQEAVVVWRPLGSWSGSGLTQTLPFISDSGTLRLRWETKNETRPGAGHFKITVHSDVSGRSLLVAVEHNGVGGDTTYVYEDPRAFFLVIDAEDLDWTVAADEAVPAVAAGAAKR